MGVIKFQTEVQLPDFLWKTGYRNKNVFIGSCFTENVGQRLENANFPVDINPFGILYNPESVAGGLEILLNNKIFSESDLIEQNGLWHSFSHHGKFSAADSNEVVSRINERIRSSSAFLKTANFLFITFGTAWVYRHCESKQVVSNCHKIPAREFVRERLSVEQILDRYKQILPKIWDVNPELKVVFTVSPIRHWKDGAIENQRSKATLMLAIDRLQHEFESRCAYFPSYEIVMDELRDYRFYAADMLHLSDVAVDYIYQKFQQVLVDEESKTIAKKVLKIRSAVQHKPFNTNTEVFVKFLKQSLRKTLDLEKQYPYLNLKLEKNYFTRHLENLEGGYSNK